MKKKNGILPGHPREDAKVVMEGKLISIIEGFKDLIKSTAKGTETVLRKEIDEKFNMTWTAITEHSRIIKEQGKEISEIKSTLAEHGNILNEHSNILNEQIKRFSAIESSIKSLDDKVSTKLDDHETRITTLEKRPNGRIAS